MNAAEVIVHAVQNGREQCEDRRFFAYFDNCLIDAKFGIIRMSRRRAIRQAEAGVAKTMIERTDIKPERLAPDTAYRSGS